jgi:demethylmenaquinone methyltransferase / 2-methoxy-6-polyprenyl-1,4-benzoquinol methylase
MSLTDFGFEQVPEEDKARRVSQVFDSVAARYDLMNDLMSAGLHRWWKRMTVERCAVRPGERVLDLAGGTGDLARLLAQRVLPAGTAVLTDVNASMLRIGRDALVDRGLVLPVVQCDAQRLPFADRSFDCITIGFGLRNVTHKEGALAEMFRVLRPGGRAVVLEFSRVWAPLQPVYDAYSFGLLPRMGRLVAGDADSYRYLAESIRVHPDQEHLKEMMQLAGFQRVDYLNLAAGVVAIHRGFRF